MSASKKRGLGRGLDALLGAGGTRPQAVSVEEDTTPAVQNVDGTLRQLPIEQLQRGRFQPRRDMHPEALEELADSIRQQGIMQPVVVRAVGVERYEIIAGERRWRAAQQAGLERVPALIREIDDAAAIAMALIENIQREDLNPLEEALALQRLQQEFELTQQQVAEAVGKSRVSVTNLMRLLSLHEDVKRLLENGDLEMGHARALLALSPHQQIDAARQVVARGLSVRQTEALVRQLQQPKSPAKDQAKDSPDVQRLEQKLQDTLGAPVKIRHQDSGKGRLEIRYTSLEELDGILQHIR
ncbi:chromosome partitioning protein ParB [Terasakiispira papahanaumokuakeensis]|uniref:Probable chromosome-partitioning protein ParB n=1 Tax=Terasakiispira papahanaumokuakeensis TaxID=197479 RepID=A0A1E2VCV0_9GAMM|nr:ParB/RepB/Spo0J family partition protein [Terasakiispira papahanaumokuakeensis]ODC04784.1 chromosome partitioning protein ParB [Terasakiispira papahanaumokuakeensis]